MLVRSIGDYGGEYVDAEPVINPQAEMSADFGNRLMADTCQLTATGYRVVVKFRTTTTGAPTTVSAANVTVMSMWGSGTAQKPTVSKTATGLYTLTFAASYTDQLNESESVSFLYAVPNVVSNTNNNDTAKIKSIGVNTIDLLVMQAGALSDLGGTADVIVWIR